MLSNLAFSTTHPWNAESPPSEKNTPDQHQIAHKSDNILTVSNVQNTPPQVRPAIALAPICPRIRKDVKPMYVNERDDEDTVSILSDDEGLALDTRFEYDENDNENSGPSCASLRQQQQYMGGNYFFRGNTIVAENDCHEVVSFPTKEQTDRDPSEMRITESSSSSLPPSTSDANNSAEASIDSHKLRDLVEALKREKSALSQKCSELENLVSESRRDHNCYKVKMTMAMGSLRIQMESERDDKAYLLSKCGHLKKELVSLRTDYDSKLGVISVLENELRPPAIANAGNEAGAGAI